MRYYAVIDTNVLVSALLKAESNPAQVIHAVFSGLVTPVVSEEILQEYAEVLNRKKFKFPPIVIKTLLDQIRSSSVVIDPLKSDFEFIDPDDAVFFDVTLSNQESVETYPVTGNQKHFPVVPYVITPKEMVDIIYG